MRVLAVLLIRLMGLVYLFSWLVSLTNILASLRYSDSYSGPLLNIWWSAVYPVVTSLLVIVLAHPIASLIVPKGAPGIPANHSLTSRGMMQVGTALIGIFILGSHLHAFIGLFILGAFERTELFSLRTAHQLIGPVIGIAIIACARFSPGLLEWPTRAVVARKPDGG